MINIRKDEENVIKDDPQVLSLENCINGIFTQNQTKPKTKTKEQKEVWERKESSNSCQMIL